MITEMMVTKVLASIGAYTVANKAIAPAAYWVGKQVGRGIGKLVSNSSKKGAKAERKEKVEVDDQAKEQAILALLAECDKALDFRDCTGEPDNMTVVETEPEPKVDKHMRDWIQRCKDQYGGFANVVLD